MTGAFEGDVIRPLGLLTLYFAYAEFELDQALQHLLPAERPESWRRKTVGQKLSLLKSVVSNLMNVLPSEFQGLLSEGRSLIERRNVLVHSCIFAGGRVVSSKQAVTEWRTSAEELTALANSIFTWKERLNVYRCRTLEPLIVKRLAAALPNSAFKGRRAKRARP